MRLLTSLLLGLISVGFSITAYIIESESTTSGMTSVKEKRTEYVADGYIKEIKVSETRTDISKMLPFLKNMPGIAAQSQVQKTETENLIVFRDNKVITYTIHHANKTYVKTEMNAAIAVYMAMSMFYDCDRQGNCRPKDENTGFKVTNEFKNVGKWKARKIITTMTTPMGQVKTTLWVTKDKLLQEAELKKLENYIRTAEKDPKIRSNPNYMRFLKDARKRIRDYIKKYGATIMSETEGIGGMRTVEVVKSVRKEKVSKDFFKVPEDYSPMGSYIKPAQPRYNYDKYQYR